MAAAGSKSPGKPAKAGAAKRDASGAAKKAAPGASAAAPVESPESGKPRAGRRLWWLWLFPLAALAAGGWFGYDYLSSLPSRVTGLETEVAAVEQLGQRLEELERLRAEDALQQAADSQAARLAAERMREALEVRLAAAERALEALGSQPAGQQSRWRLDAADNLLALADRQNRLARDHAGAALAVREALELLAQVGDPRYGALRAELQEQARALERMPARDIQGVVVRLGALLSRVEGLEPQLGPLPGEPPDADELPGQGWQRALASVRRALRSLIMVRRTEGGVDTLLTDTDTQTLKRLLAAELHLARLAYIQGDHQAYSAALVAARGRLSRLYAADDADVADTLADIDELRELAPGRDAPDIASSLQRLRDIRSGQGQD